MESLSTSSGRNVGERSGQLNVRWLRLLSGLVSEATCPTWLCGNAGGRRAGATANPRALSSRNIAKKLGQRLRPCW